MKIRFKQDVELETIYGFDEATDTVTESYFERFNKDEIIEADIVGTLTKKDKTCTLSFLNGSCAYNVELTWFDIL